jgi:hypothetical protein
MMKNADSLFFTFGTTVVRVLIDAHEPLEWNAISAINPPDGQTNGNIQPID